MDWFVAKHLPLGFPAYKYCSYAGRCLIIRVLSDHTARKELFLSCPAKNSNYQRPKKEFRNLKTNTQ